MYSLEQLYSMAEAGLIDWSVYYGAIEAQQQMSDERSFHVQQAIDSHRADQQANIWAASTDAMYGTNLQQQAAELRAKCQQASAEGARSMVNKYFGG